MFDLDYGKTAEVEIGGLTLTVERIRFTDIEKNDRVLHSHQDEFGFRKHWVGEASVRGQVPGWFTNYSSYYSDSLKSDWEERDWRILNGTTVAYDWHDIEDGHALFRVLSGWDASLS